MKLGMVFRLTRKLATKLGVEPVPSLPPGGSPLHDWTANLFVVDRLQFIILTNTATLYSSIIPGRGNTGSSVFIENALAGIGENLKLDGLDSLLKPLMAAPPEDLAFCKASDKRVLGSINEFVFMARYCILDGERSLTGISCFLNQSHMKAIRYGRPLDEMRRLLTDRNPDSSSLEGSVSRLPLERETGYVSPIHWVGDVMVAGDPIEKPSAEIEVELKAPEKPSGGTKGVRKQQRKVFQFRISLKGTKLPIWRRIQISSKATFWDLHRAIQDSMGWLDYHMHEFRIPLPGWIGEIPVGIPSDDDFGQEPTRPGWKLKIRDVFWKPGVKIDYVYDFGDDWLHVVELEKILPAEEGVTYPRCIAGRRRCPPEDCGGVWSFADMLRIIADPSHPEYAEWKTWLGESYDPARFSADEVDFMDSKECLKMLFDELRES